MMREKLLKIVYWTPDDNLQGIPKPLARDRIEAAKNVVMTDLALLNAEIANGMYKKLVEALAKEIRNDPLPEDVRIVVIQSWRNLGLLPEAIIQEMVPEKTV
jgi:hypothetical protein